MAAGLPEKTWDVKASTTKQERVMGRKLGGPDLVGPLAVLFVHDQFVEDGQNFFAVGVHVLQAVLELGTELAAADPFFGGAAGDINILAQVLGGVAAQEESVEHGRFALRRQWVVVVPEQHWQISQS